MPDNKNVFPIIGYECGSCGATYLVNPGACSLSGCPGRVRIKQDLPQEMRRTGHCGKCHRYCQYSHASPLCDFCYYRYKAGDEELKALGGDWERVIREDRELRLKNDALWQRSRRLEITLKDVAGELYAPVLDLINSLPAEVQMTPRVTRILEAMGNVYTDDAPADMFKDPDVRRSLEIEMPAEQHGPF